MREVWIKVGKRDPFLSEADVDLYISQLIEIVKTECSHLFDNIATNKINIQDNEGNVFNSIHKISECNGYETK